MAFTNPRDKSVTIKRRQGFALVEYTAGTTDKAVTESYYNIVDSKDRTIVFARFYESPAKKHEAAIAEFNDFCNNRA